jgi:signal peptidase I
VTTPNDASREPAIDPSDPRWVDDVLERARRRAEQTRRAAAPAPVDPASTPPSAPPRPTPPGAASPPSAPPGAATPPPGAVRPAGPRPAGSRPVGAGRPPTVDQPRPGAPVPRRRVEFAPLDDPDATATPAAAATTAAAAPAAPAAPGAGEAVRRERARAAAGTVTAPGAPAGPARRGEPAVATQRRVAPDTDPAFDRTGEVVLGPADAGADDEGEARTLRSWLEWGAVIVGALVVAFLIRAVAFQAFYIPSESMEHTLEVKDRILVNKLSYRLHDVNRGDIIVFEKPPGETSKINDLIKRVIALPGETIEQQGKDIYIDRGQGPQKLTETYVSDPADMGPAISWVQGCANPSSENTRCTIPDGHVWVMGDNRGHSHDSRMFGPIDEDLIVGRAFVKVWPLNKLGFL